MGNLNRHSTHSRSTCESLSRESKQHLLFLSPGGGGGGKMSAGFLGHLRSKNRLVKNMNLSLDLVCVSPSAHGGSQVFQTFSLILFPTLRFSTAILPAERMSVQEGETSPPLVRHRLVQAMN